MKHPTSIRLSDLAIRQLPSLNEATGLNQSAVINQAIDRMFQQEIKTMNTIANTQQTLCPHCGAEYDSASGNHICQVDELEGLIYNESKFEDEPDQKQIAEWKERIAQVKEFWCKHPNFQSGVSKQMPA